MGVVVPFVIPRRDSSVERLDYSVERVGGRVAAILDALDRSSQSKSPCPRPASEILARAQFSLEIILHSKSRVRASRSRSEGRPLSLRRVIPPSAITTRGSRQARRRLVMIHSRVGESPTLPARSRRTQLGTLAASAHRGPSPHVVTLARGLRRLRAAAPVVEAIRRTAVPPTARARFTSNHATLSAAVLLERTPARTMEAVHSSRMSMRTPVENSCRGLLSRRELLSRQGLLP